MRDYDDCRTYLDHLCAEHKRLHSLLRGVRAAVAESLAATDGENSPLTEVAQVVQGMRQELSHHFAQEDAGGCLDEAVSRCPRLSGEAKRIEAEHPEILAEVDRLLAIAELPMKPDGAFQIAFEALCQRIRAHERAEAQLLMEGFGSDFVGDENGYPDATPVSSEHLA